MDSRFAICWSVCPSIARFKISFSRSERRPLSNSIVSVRNCNDCHRAGAASLAVVKTLYKPLQTCTYYRASPALTRKAAGLFVFEPYEWVFQGEPSSGDANGRFAVIL